ncbi:MAG TPA: UDP-N-acetylmuramate dehydrogenase [Acidimicrobiales bacterium]|nr:UDP-N-acetylmuramate dehydrogenase [Acidimicrobiales bacterium]
MSTLEDLVNVGGARVLEHAPLGARTTYRVGGSARLLVTLSTLGDLDELGPLIRGAGLDVVMLGNGSNLLVEEGEHDVLVVHLTDELSTLTWRDEGSVVVVNAGAGLDLPIAARRLAKEGVVGFEWAVGVPGTFGGAVAMNAGGHGSDIAASIFAASIWHESDVTSWTKEQLGLSYRTSALVPGDVVLSVTLRLTRGDVIEAETRLRDIVRWRREHQPGGANGGSVFRNPANDHAARLIEAAGCKGLRLNSAVVSEKHANFIQVDSGGSAQDVFALLTLVRERVEKDSGTTLISEHRFVGFGYTT